MAINTIFEGTYGELGSSQEYTLRIGTRSGDVGTIPDSEKRLELYTPGIEINWSAGSKFLTPVIGSSMSFTAALSESQLSKWNALLDLPEGDVYALLFKGRKTTWVQDDLEWAGHLLIESATIQIEQDRSHFTCSFTDGLGSLKGAPWVDGDGTEYEGHLDTSYYIKEILAKLPGVQAMAATFTGTLGLFNETGIPYYEGKWSDGSFYKFPEGESVFARTKIYARTFNIPKKQENRSENFRQMEAPPEYFSTKDVLEDILVAFGASIAFYSGRFHIVGRSSLAFFEGSSSLKSNLFFWTPSTGAITYAQDLTTSYNVGDVTKKMFFIEGATKSRGLPYKTATLTHEEGGSDTIYIDGIFLNSDPNEWPTMLSGSRYQTTGLRRDITFRYENRGLTDLVERDWTHLKQPHLPEDYTGFDAETLQNLALSSGQNLRFTFGGVYQAYHQTVIGEAASSALQRVHVGTTAIVRARVQVTDENGESYRLSRTVFTHKQTGGVDDFITINNIKTHYASGVLQTEDREYFRKLYNDLIWVHQDEDDYDDSWYELIIPHGDTVNVGDGWGSTMHQLTEQYGGQIGYAPIGTEPEGYDPDDENAYVSGAGVVLKYSEDDNTYLQYFKEDVRFYLPTPADGVGVLFESLYIEWGLEVWESDSGPRPNDGSSLNPLYRSATWGNADGYNQYNSILAHPEYIHFVGARIALGDGGNISDLNTKVSGGDGYEITNLGATRLGSRVEFVYPHNSGTVWGQLRSSATTWSSVYGEKLKWRPHNAADSTYGAGSLVVYDSLHVTVCSEFLELFGGAHTIVSGKLINRDENETSLIGIFECITTSQLDDINTYTLMPIKVQWSLSDGCSITALLVGQDRYADVEEYVEEKGPTRGGGRIHFKPGYGSVAVAFEGAGVQDEIDGVVGDISDIKDNILAQLELFGIFMERK